MPAANALVDAAIRWFRRRRMGRFVRACGVSGATRVLDVGGTPGNWELLSVRPRLTLLNTPRAREKAPAGVDWVSGDGCLLPFADGSFDIVFSNSVIEHVGSEERQRAFAREAARVGVHYWIQTPNRRFPIELHLLTPLVHFLPKRWQRRLIPRFTIWALLTRPSPDQREFYVEHFLNEVRLLDGAALGGLFPGARILRERFLGLSKALIATR